MFFCKKNVEEFVFKNFLYKMIMYFFSKEKLLSICDQLEKRIAENQTYPEQLMQAVLKKAFSQNEDKNMEAD